MPEAASITGVTGQDGACLAGLLLARGDAVHGVARRASSFTAARSDHLDRDPHIKDARFPLRQRPASTYAESQENAAFARGIATGAAA